MKTLADCEAAMRKCAMSMPPSDFGSFRAIDAAARVMHAAIEAGYSEGFKAGQAVFDRKPVPTNFD